MVFVTLVSVSARGEFYERIVGVKGPTYEKEVERMVRRIKYFLRSSSSDCTFGGGLGLSFNRR